MPEAPGCSVFRGRLVSCGTMRITIQRARSKSMRHGRPGGEINQRTPSVSSRSSQQVGRSAGQQVGRSAGRQASRSAGRQVGTSAVRQVGRSTGRLASRQAARPPGLNRGPTWANLGQTWANLWANLGQTWANLCNFRANLPGDGLGRARILRKKWDGRHHVIRGKCPYYNTKRGNSGDFLGRGRGGADSGTPFPPFPAF